jgi:hypothetical protein
MLVAAVLRQTQIGFIAKLPSVVSEYTPKVGGLKLKSDEAWAEDLVEGAEI